MGKKIEYLFVKKKDDFCNTVEQFQNLLLTNSMLSIQKNVLSIGSHQVKYNIIEQDIERTEEFSFFLRLESLAGSEEEKEIEALEKADRVLRRIVETYANFFYINTIWDDISTYYGLKAYPRISNIENKMRKIVYVFMIQNTGSKWVEKHIPRDVKESIRKTFENNNIHNMLEDCLYSADFTQLGYFFFEKYLINNNLQTLVFELKKSKVLDSANIDKIVERYQSKSNWERYFAGETQIDKLPEKWKALRDFRTKVANYKKIEKEDYADAINVLDELESAFDKCLERVNQIIVHEFEQKAVEEMAQKSIEKNLISNLEYAISGKYPSYSIKENSSLSTEGLGLYDSIGKKSNFQVGRLGLYDSIGKSSNPPTEELESDDSEDKKNDPPTKPPTGGLRLPYSLGKKNNPSIARLGQYITMGKIKREKSPAESTKDNKNLDEKHTDSTEEIKIIDMLEEKNNDSNQEN